MVTCVIEDDEELNGVAMYASARRWMAQLPVHRLNLGVLRVNTTCFVLRYVSQNSSDIVVAILGEMSDQATVLSKNWSNHTVVWSLSFLSPSR